MEEQKDLNDDESDNEDEGGDKEEGFVAFSGRQIKAILYKLSPMTDEIKAKMTAYVHEGYLDKDRRFAREVFGRTNTSGRKDFLDYWESPWIEEQVKETPKKRRQDSMQKASAVRNFVKNASAQQDSQDLDKYMSTFDTLSRWQDQSDENDSVKTVSRFVQSFERVAARNIMAALDDGWASSYSNARRHMRRLGNITNSCHALRRHDILFDVFASLVAVEISWADATNGTRNTPIYMCRQIQDNRKSAMLLFVRELDDIHVQMEADTMGIPLMHINCNMCVSSNGILVMGKDSTDAIYVLDMLNGFNAQGQLDLTNVKTIHISQMFSEKDEAGMQAVREREKEKEKRVLRSRGKKAKLTDIV